MRILSTVFILIIGSQWFITAETPPESGLPKLSMTDIRAKPRQSVNVTCEVHGHPRSNVSITFTPCRTPTYCYAEKTLITTEQKELNANVSVSFDPNSYSGKVVCTANNSMGSVNTTAILKVFQFDSDFFISNDRYMDDYEGSFGDKLVCNINNYLYAWTDPTWFKDGEKMKRMEYPGVQMSAGSDGYRQEQTLTWFSSWGTYREPGEYVCKVKRLSDDTIEEKVIRIEKIEPELPNGELIVESEMGESVFVRPRRGEVEFRVTYNGNPLPKQTWLDNRGEKVRWTYSKIDSGASIIARSEDQWAMLKLRNLYPENAGNYTFIADNGHKRKEITFTLFIEVPPSIRLDTWPKHVEPGQLAKVPCEVSGYPFPNISITFTPCNDETSCSESSLKLESPNEKKLKQTVEISFKPESSGILMCAAENSLRKSNRTVEIISSNLMQDMVISTNRVKAAHDTSHYIDELQCAINLYRYHEDITWIKDGEPIKDVVEATSTNGNVYTKTLQWPSALNSFKQAGRYTCRAKRRKGGSVKENVWTITKVQAVETISHVAQGNAFEFECKSSYTPKQVQWFKNDVNQIEADENTVGINLLRNNRTLFISNVKASDGGKYLCIASNQFGETHSQQMLSVQKDSSDETTTRRAN